MSTTNIRFTTPVKNDQANYLQKPTNKLSAAASSHQSAVSTQNSSASMEKTNSCHQSTGSRSNIGSYISNGSKKQSSVTRRTRQTSLKGKDFSSADKRKNFCSLPRHPVVREQQTHQKPHVNKIFNSTQADRPSLSNAMDEEPSTQIPSTFNYNKMVSPG